MVGEVIAVFPGGGGVTSAQNKAVDQIAKRTRDLKNEQLRIINEDGEVVLEKRGTGHEVATTVGEKRQYGEGSVIIHNHPNGGTFSDADLNSFGYGARQIVVAAPEGTYKLTNTKYGQRDAKSGWYDMRNDMDLSGVTRERSFTELTRQARETPAVKRAGTALSKASSAYLDAQKAGKPQSTLDRLMDDFTKKEKAHKEAFAKARRDVEVKPYHDYYRKNAHKYGFKYEFIKR